MSSIDSFSNVFPFINIKLRKCEQILSFIGLYFVCKLSSKLIYKIFNLSYVHIWSQIRGNHFNCSNGSNGWAIITFVANKTGVSFAKTLAEKGFNLILIDENQQILELISDQILSEFRVEVKTITVDLSIGLESYQLIEEQIKDKDIIVLINNVSLINEFNDNYMDFSAKQISVIINKEMVSVLLMSSIVLPQMYRRRNGYIINISSILAVTPMPYLSLHSASKSFVDRFSTALSFECKTNGIIVQSLMPSLCSEESITGLIAPKHKTYAKFALNTIGSTNRTTGYLGHELHYWLLRRIPQHFSPYFSNLFKTYFTSNPNNFVNNPNKSF